MTSTSVASPSFGDLALLPAVLSAVEAQGYETPSPIQAQTIPALLEGRDMLGQAQTGTGKTAAFASPKYWYSHRPANLLSRSPSLLVNMVRIFRAWKSLPCVAVKSTVNS